MRTCALGAVLLTVVGVSAGCVERTLIVKSDPEGAEVWVDGRQRGVTPLEVPFESYGTRALVLRKEGHVPARVQVELPAPWWQFPPADLVTDLLWPGTIEDVRETELVVLARRGEPETAEALAERARHFGRSARQRP